MVEANTRSAGHELHGAGRSPFDTHGHHGRGAGHTIQAICDPTSTPSDFARPGHLFPLVAKEGGVLRRAGHTEAAVDLARLAGLLPAGVLCEILDESGDRANREQLHELARRVRICRSFRSSS